MNGFNNLLRRIYNDWNDKNVWYIEKWPNYFVYIHEFEIYKNILKKHDLTNKKILDVGAGRGRFSYFLKKKNLDVISFDLCENMLKSIKEKEDNLEFNLVKGDACNLPFKNDSFDMILIPQVIAHIFELDGFVKEIDRVSNENCTVTLSTGNLYSVIESRDRIINFIKTQDINNSFFKTNRYYWISNRGFCRDSINDLINLFDNFNLITINYSGFLSFIGRYGKYLEIFTQIWPFKLISHLIIFEFKKKNNLILKK